MFEIIIFKIFNDIIIKEFNTIMNINVLAPLTLIQNSLKGKSLKQVVNISSLMGSMSNCNGDFYLYRSSKSLLNSITKKLISSFNPYVGSQKNTMRQKTNKSIQQF